MEPERKFYLIAIFLLGINILLTGCSMDGVKSGSGSSGKEASSSVETAATPAPTQSALKIKGATILPGEKIQIEVKKREIQKAVSSDDCVTVTPQGEVTARQPGKSVVTVTDACGYEYEFPVWVREKKGTLGQEVRVVIMGNSLMGQGYFRLGLREAAEAYGQKLVTQDYSISGYSFEKHLRNLKKKKNRDMVKEIGRADIVVVHGMSWENPASVVKRMKKYCKNSARVYYYETVLMTWTESANDLQKVKDMKNADVIMAEEMLRAICEVGYFMDDFLSPDDFHPNTINLRLSAILAYGLMFDEKASEYPEALISEWFYSMLKGDTLEEQNECFYKICDIIDQQLESYHNGTVSDLMSNPSFFDK